MSRKKGLRYPDLSPYKLKRFSDIEVQAIREGVNRGLYYTELAKAFDCSTPTISKIASGKTYQHVQPLKSNSLSSRGRGNKTKGRLLKITEQDYDEIIKRFKSGESSRNIAADYDVCHETIRKYGRQLVGKPLRKDEDENFKHTPRIKAGTSPPVG